MKSDKWSVRLAAAQIIRPGRARHSVRAVVANPEPAIFKNGWQRTAGVTNGKNGMKISLARGRVWLNILPRTSGMGWQTVN
jgi:hypothetical protein